MTLKAFSQSFVQRFLSCRIPGKLLKVLVMDRRCKPSLFEGKSVFFVENGICCYGNGFETWERRHSETLINLDRWAETYLQKKDGDSQLRSSYMQWANVAESAGNQVRELLNENSSIGLFSSGIHVWCLLMNEVCWRTRLVPGRGPIPTDSVEVVDALVASVRGEVPAPSKCEHFIYTDMIEASAALSQLLADEDTQLLTITNGSNEAQAPPLLRFFSGGAELGAKPGDSEVFLSEVEETQHLKKLTAGSRRNDAVFGNIIVSARIVDEHKQGLRDWPGASYSLRVSNQFLRRPDVGDVLHCARRLGASLHWGPLDDWTVVRNLMQWLMSEHKLDETATIDLSFDELKRLLLVEGSQLVIASAHKRKTVAECHQPNKRGPKLNKRGPKLKAPQATQEIRAAYDEYSKTLAEGVRLTFEGLAKFIWSRWEIADEYPEAVNHLWGDEDPNASGNWKNAPNEIRRRIRAARKPKAENSKH